MNNKNQCVNRGCIYCMASYNNILVNAADTTIDWLVGIDHVIVPSFQMPFNLKSNRVHLKLMSRGCVFKSKNGMRLKRLYIQNFKQIATTSNCLIAGSFDGTFLLWCHRNLDKCLKLNISISLNMEHVMWKWHNHHFTSVRTHWGIFLFRKNK